MYWYDNSGNVVGFFYTDKTAASPVTKAYVYTKNTLGDVTGIVDSTGNIVAKYVYDPWGMVIAVTDGNGNDVSATANHIANINPIRYRGYYLDSETGFYYLQSRYYFPLWKRFINADDSQNIGETGNFLGINAFAYCENNPISYIDPEGNVVTPANVIGAAIGAVIGIVGGLFLGNWFADILKLKGWRRGLFIGGVTALVGAAAAAIGYFVGPYVSKIAVKLGKYIAKLVQKGKLVLKKLSTKAKTAVRSLVEKTCCFVAGTLVSTPSGEKTIEDIAIGDYVYSKNTSTGEFGAKKVSNVFVKKTYTLYHVITDKEVIIASEEHPFWVRQNGWVAARDLLPGDDLCSLSGENVKIINVFVEFLRNPVEVYNFEVEDWHTYFVGKNNVLVHNKCSLTKLSDNYLKKKHIDPHALKKEYLGKNADISRYNLYKDKESGVVFILRNGAKGDARIATHIVLK